MKPRFLRFEPPLLFAIFLDLVGFGMMFPDIQLRAEQFGASGGMIGVVLASYYLVQMCASPFWGRLSDRFGRKPTLLLCSSISAGSMLIYALGQSVEAMLLSRIMAGLGAANVATAQAYLAETQDEATRAIAQGRMSAAISAGLVLGPVIGGFLAHQGGNRLLGLTAATASGIGLLWIIVGVPAQDKPKTVAPVSDFRAIPLLKNHDDLQRLFLLAIVGWFALACLEGTFGRLIERTLHYGQLELGLLLSVEAIVAVVQAGVFAYFARRFAPDTLMGISYLLQALGLGLMPFAPHLGGLIVLSISFGCGVGLVTPTINGRASMLTPEARQGEVFGLLQSARAIGFLLGPILGGVLFDVRPEIPYVLSAGVLLCLGLMLCMTGRHAHSHHHERLEHSHWHRHDVHHQHQHEPGVDPSEPHCHAHIHEPMTHTHAHSSDNHHRHKHI
jgi:MFS family permease